MLISVLITERFARTTDLAITNQTIDDSPSSSDEPEASFDVRRLRRTVSQHSDSSSGSNGDSEHRIDDPSPTDIPEPPMSSAASTNPNSDSSMIAGDLPSENIQAVSSAQINLNTTGRSKRVRIERPRSMSETNCDDSDCEDSAATHPWVECAGPACGLKVSQLIPPLAIPRGI